jgi:hypothetical protein
MRPKIILTLSLPLALLVIVVSCTGLFTERFYQLETPNWEAQSVGQDMVDLFLITPCLLLSSFLACRNERYFGVWAGTMLYLTYTFMLYCFEVHFNKLFPVYCVCLGLSFYSALYFFAAAGKDKGAFEKSKLDRITGIYFIGIATIFYLLWLAEIIPSAVSNSTPKSVTEAGLFTNGVHVLDLSIILPGIFITGIFVLQDKTIGKVVASVILTFFILMDLTIGTLVLVMKERGLEGSLILTTVMGLLALVSLMLLIGHLRRSRAADNH